jgi:predicted porin
MNKKINLAVAGAALALGASATNAGIVIPAGDWTLDVNGNVNAFMNFNDADAAQGTAPTGAIANGQDALGESDSQGINTGLLPSWLGFTGTTRQNNTDVSFTISFQPNASDNSAPYHGDSKTPLNRQSYLSFGDKSWGSIKLGKDIGIFASGAILNDMTLLGVGSGANGRSGGATTLGGIGTGYVYAAWKGQATYTTPNMGGFQAKVGLMNPNNIPDANTAVTTRTYETTATFTGSKATTAGSASGSDLQAISVTITSAGTIVAATSHIDTVTGAAASAINQDRFGVEAEASYSWTGDVAGKVWVSGASYEVTRQTAASTAAAPVEQSYDIEAFDIGASLSAGNFGLVGYYYDGEGLGTTLFGNSGVTAAGKERDSDGGYVQATYVIPTGTKLGVAYGVSNLDTASGETNATLVEENERWTVGAYHPLTKHLNLVAEYNSTESTGQDSSNKSENDSLSLGAILFF